METMDAVELETDVRRIVSRLQAALAKSSHAASSEEDVIKRWSYVEYIQKQLAVLRDNYKDDPQASTRLNEYSEKLEFCTQLMYVCVDGLCFDA